MAEDNKNLPQNNQDDELIFEEENTLDCHKEEQQKQENKLEKVVSRHSSIQSKYINFNQWKILLVDDDQAVHNATKLALDGLKFQGKSLNFLSAFSGEEAKQLMKNNPDIAMVLLDVIMESEDAGLEVVKYIRNVLNNKLVRIILFTGQSGQIPEGKVIIDYDINDYKTKNELTRQKLLTKVITSFRGFKALIEMEKIAEENAKLYRKVQEYAYDLEKKVAERTKQLAIANQELERLVRLDSLTKVANRHHFNEYLLQEWQRLAREKQILSLILIDVDYFKPYNDCYGHLQGDCCLQKVAQAISNVIKRPADLVARYGGEEFTVILPNTNLEGAMIVANKIHGSIRNLQIPHQKSQVSEYVSVSIGVSSYIPEYQLSPDILINITDEALYQAKRQGRDRICSISNHTMNNEA